MPRTGPASTSLRVGITALITFFPVAESLGAVRGPYTLEPVQAVAARDTAGGDGRDTMIAAIVTTPAGPQVLLLGRDRTSGPIDVVGRWPDASPGHATNDGDRSVRQRRSDVDDTLWLYGLADAERDTWLMDDLLEQEGLDDVGRPRRPPPRTPRPIPRALAGAGSELWLATSRGVWRLEGQGFAARWRPCGLAERDVSRLAVTIDEGGRVVIEARTDGTVWRTDNRGASWQPVGPGDDGSLANRSGTGRGSTGRRHSPEAGRRLPAADVTAVAVAGDDVWIGSRHGLYAADLEDDLDAWSAAGLLRAAGADLSELDDGTTRAAPARPAWTRFVPRVALELGAGLRGPRHELRAVIIVTLPLQKVLR